MALRRWMMGVTVSLVASAAAMAACGGDDVIGSSTDAGGTGSDATTGGDAATTDSGGAKDSGGGGSDAGPDATAAETAACLAVADAACAQIQNCFIGDVTEAAAANLCAKAQEACPGALFGGGAGFSVDQANACAAQIAGLSCNDLNNLFELTNASWPPFAALSACVVPGARSGGDTCEANAQCASLRCVSPESNTAVAFNSPPGSTGACGTCEGVYGPNDDCTNGGPFGGMVCAPGTACDSFSRRCMAVTIGGACVSGEICPPASTCTANPDGGVGNVCVALPTTGMPCSNGSCAGSDYCHYADESDNVGTCAAPIAAGKSCVDPFSDAVCVAGAQCVSVPIDGGFTLQCVAGPTDGMPCTGELTCAATAYCDQRVQGKPTCKNLIANGQPCGQVPETYPDGGPTGAAVPTFCAGECSTGCDPLNDGGSMGVCIGGPLGGRTGDVCGSNACTTCAPGSNCVNGACAPASLHCN